MNKSKLSKIIAALIFCVLVTIAVVIVGVNLGTSKGAKISITFDGNSGALNGNTTVTDTVAKDSYVSDLSRFIPTRVGYDFVGWATDANGENMLSSTDKLTSDTTLYAIWAIQKVTLKYDLMGGTGTLADVVVDYGSEVTIAADSAVSRANYTFVGWYMDRTYVNKASATMVLTGDTTVYARWQGNPRTLNIYDYDFLNGKYSESASKTVNTNYGATVDLTSFDSKDHYTFLGFSDVEEIDFVANTADKVKFTTSILINSDEDVMKLYSVYQANTYTLTIDGEVVESHKYGEQSEEEPVKFTVPATTLTKFGHNVNGFVDADENLYAEDDKLDVDKDYVLTTNFVARPVVVTVITHNNAEDMTEKTTAATLNKYFGEEVLLSEYHNDTSYASQWYVTYPKDMAVRDFKLVLDETCIPTDDVESLQVTVENKVDTADKTISFVTEDGETLMNGEEAYAKTIVFNGDYELTAEDITLLNTLYAKTGHSLKALKDADENEYNITVGTVLSKVRKDVTFAPVYSVNKYTVSYKIGDDDWGSPVEFEYGSALILATKEDVGISSFAGWSYTDDGASPVVDTDKMPDRNIVVYAIYDRIYSIEVVGDHAVVKGFQEGKDVAEVVIPEIYLGKPVTEIAEGAFEENTTITSVQFGANIEVIGESAFEKCTNLETVEFADGSIVIGVNAFCNCTALQAIELNIVASDSSDTTIEDNAFWGCTSLATLEMQADAESSCGYIIGWGAFGYCESLTYVDLSCVKEIGKWGFYGAGITRVELVGENITSIGPAAFSHTQITSLYIGEVSDKEGSVYAGMENPSFVETALLEKSGQDLFSSCTALTRVEVGVSVTNLVNGMFTNCSSLTTTSTLFTSNIEIFGEYTFENTAFKFDLCSSYDRPVTLENETVVTEHVEVYGKLNLNSKVTKISEGLFKGVTTLVSVNFDHDIEIEDKAFMDCENLVGGNISFLEADKNVAGLVDITKIGKHAFYGTGIENIYIDEDVEAIEIGEYAFANSKLKSISLYYDLTLDTDADVYKDASGSIIVGKNAFAGLGEVTIDFGSEGTAVAEDVKVALFGNNDKITDENA